LRAKNGRVEGGKVFDADSRSELVVDNAIKHGRRDADYRNVEGLRTTSQ
jgi:hypothetical protein